MRNVTKRQGAAFKSPIEVREWVWTTTVGIAGVDTVEFLNSGTKEIRLHHEDVPDYRAKAAFALESEVYFP